MKIEWIYQGEEDRLLRELIYEKGISRSLLSKIKFSSGKIEVNQIERNVRYLVQKGDQIAITLPSEKGNSNLLANSKPLDILYEDEHFLILNKPIGYTSVPNEYQDTQSMANFVKAYIQERNYEHQNVHVVTRLDRDTSGAIIFAKHALAHSLLDKQLQAKSLIKRYLAFLSGPYDEEKDKHGYWDFPIGRYDLPTVKRCVSDEGKPALTEYWIQEVYPKMTVAKLQLHTGRTHQIRVHAAHIGHPLIGDGLYGGLMGEGFSRQALHCQEVSFFHPFMEEDLTVKAPLALDMKKFILEI